MNSNTNEDTRAAHKTVVLGIISGLIIGLYGLFVSRSHITEVAYWANIGGDWECETAFIVVDVLVLYGKILTSKRLTAKTRRAGYRLMVIGGIASVLCNIGAGLIHGSYGASVWGVAIVGVVALIEHSISVTEAKRTIKRAAKATAPAAPAVVKANRACATGCTCRRHTANRVPVTTQSVMVP